MATMHRHTAQLMSMPNSQSAAVAMTKHLQATILANRTDIITILKTSLPTKTETSSI